MDRELPLTLKLSFRLWLSWYWRHCLISLTIIAILLPFVIFLGMPSWLKSQNGRIFLLVVDFISGFVISFVTFVWFLGANFRDVRIVIQSRKSNTEAPQQQTGKPTGFDY